MEHYLTLISAHGPPLGQGPGAATGPPAGTQTGFQETLHSFSNPGAETITDPGRATLPETELPSPHDPAEGPPEGEAVIAALAQVLFLPQQGAVKLLGQPETPTAVSEAVPETNQVLSDLAHLQGQLSPGILKGLRDALAAGDREALAQVWEDSGLKARAGEQAQEVLKALVDAGHQAQSEASTRTEARGENPSGELEGKPHPAAARQPVKLKDQDPGQTPLSPGKASAEPTQDKAAAVRQQSHPAPLENPTPQQPEEGSPSSRSSEQVSPDPASEPKAASGAEGQGSSLEVDVEDVEKKVPSHSAGRGGDPGSEDGEKSTKFSQRDPKPGETQQAAPSDSDPELVSKLDNQFSAAVEDVQEQTKQFQPVKQVTTSVEELIESQKNRLKVQLRPQKLGKMEIDLSRGENGLNVNIQADSDQTAQLLRQHLEEIKSSLSRSGIQLNDLSVSQRDQEQAFSGGQPRKHGANRHPVPEEQESTISRGRDREHTLVEYLI